uniref:Ubiquitin-like-specific protease 1 n=1 Tax=Lygus hesperus TaxID=30085 RepID=A0A146L9W8_LYGHE
MWDPTTESFVYNYEYVRMWSRRQNVRLVELDRLLIPVHISGNHWTLSCVNFNSKTFEYYDNLRGSDRGILRCLRSYVRDEIETYSADRPTRSKLLQDLAGWRDFIDLKIPLQRNGYDCGVFILYMARLLCSDAPMYITGADGSSVPTFTQTDITHFRAHIARSLLHGTIL